jgi:hypothetical protein
MYYHIVRDFKVRWHFQGPYQARLYKKYEQLHSLKLNSQESAQLLVIQIKKKKRVFHRSAVFQYFWHEEYEINMRKKTAISYDFT